MAGARRRQKGGYFACRAGAPPPVCLSVRRRVSFSDVDPMGILWHGRYANYFEQANEELGRRCGMSYTDFRAECLRAPIVQFHVDYFASPVLGEEVVIRGRLIWDDGARLNIEYEIVKEDGTLAATGYSIQMFVTEQGEPIYVSPPMLQRCRQRWLSGEFADLP